MKQKLTSALLLIVIALAIFGISSTYAVFKDVKHGTGTVTGATWSVTRNQSGSSTVLNVIPDSVNDSYTLTVESNSEVDVTYTVVINNLPPGIEVKLDNNSFTSQVTAGTITFPNVGTITYNDNDRIRTHTLTFKALDNTSPVSNQQINIDVRFKQVL